MRPVAAFLFLTSLGSASDYTTYIGDSNRYRISAIVTDAPGNTYVTGNRILDLPGSPSDLFVTKLDPSGNIVFTSTLAGKGSDQAKAIALDPAGNVYIGGSTSSTDFPLSNALQRQPNSVGTGFIVKFSFDGGTLLYSTYFGGTDGASSVEALAVDTKGNLYVTGSTSSTDYPQTAGLPPRHLHTGETVGAFVAEIAPAGDKIVYSGALAGSIVACGAGSTCFLSTRVTGGVAIAVDVAGNAYIAGNSNTTDLPTTPAALLTRGIGAFVAKVNAGGNGLGYLTYIGSANFVFYPFSNPGNTINAIAVDSAGNAHLAGSTSDPKFPATPNAFQTTFSGHPPTDPYSQPTSDAFVAKLRPDGTAMIWATYLGGAAGESARSIAVDSAGSVWVAGTTNSPDFPNSNGWSQGGDFLVALNSTGSALPYSARYPDGTVAQSIAVDSTGLIHAAGLNGIVSTITPGQPPSMKIFGIANAAGGSVSGRLSPGEVISIYGPRIGPIIPASFTVDALGFVPKSLAGVQVMIGNKLAPLLYVSDTQINAVVPSDLPNSPFTMKVSSREGTSTNFRGVVGRTEPGIFTNAAGQAAVNEDGTINSPDNPAKPASVISVWATGMGFGYPATDGQVATAAQQYCFFCQIQVGSQLLDVLYAGAAPGLVAGITQINFRLPVRSFGLFNLIVNGFASAPLASAPFQVYVSP